MSAHVVVRTPLEEPLVEQALLLAR